ncbi:IS2 ORF2 [Shigella flexneri]|uniref:IS2 ORF2 n=1 Tax=Shigella flexneri TaxID=623 RepID=A0A658Z4Y8_SHIFL|nr:IS2 ORF2 [Shigella flexneri]
MLPSETMIWQPEFTDKTLSRKPGAVQRVFTDVVVYFHPAVTTELVQRIPVIQDIVERLRHLRMFRQRFPLQLYPVVQRLHQLDASGFSDCKPFLCLKWHTEFGHLNRGDMLTSEQHRCSNEKKKF